MIYEIIMKESFICNGKLMLIDVQVYESIGLLYAEVITGLKKGMKILC
jgi:hypothetical protein